DAVRLQSAPNLIEYPIQVCNVLKHVHANYTVDRMVSYRNALAVADLVFDFEALAFGVSLGHADRSLRGINANDRCAPSRQRFRHEAAAASEVEHGLPAPAPDDRVEIRKPRRNQVVQQSQKPLRSIPPIRRVGAINRNII